MPGRAGNENPHSDLLGRLVIRLSTVTVASDATGCHHLWDLVLSPMMGAMARWEPNARERLERAALALFAENGYDATTVAQIADRAGLTKSTFFRNFADK